MPERRAACDAAPPRQCLDAFGRITEQLGRISAKADAIQEAATRIDGQVGKLSDRTGRHETQIQLLRADLAADHRGRATWGRRFWEALIGLGLLLAGYLLKS